MKLAATNIAQDWILGEFPVSVQMWRRLEDLFHRPQAILTFWAVGPDKVENVEEWRLIIKPPSASSSPLCQRLKIFIVKCDDGSSFNCDGSFINFIITARLISKDRGYRGKTSV
jgi:hypothetical protein